MQLKRIYAAVMLSAPLWLAGCQSGIPNPVSNPPPRERAEVAADNYEKYDAIAPAKKILILNEEFNANTRGWRVVTTSPEYNLTIEGGELDMFTRYNTQLNTISLPELKGTDDFEIEASILIDYTWDRGSATLLWGGSTATAKQWSYVRLDDNTETFTVGRVNEFYETYSSGYNSEGYNTIIIRKVKNTYYYFINGRYQGKKPFTVLDGPKIGFEAGYNTQMYVDYLRVRRLTP